MSDQSPQKKEKKPATKPTLLDAAHELQQDQKDYDAAKKNPSLKKLITESKQQITTKAAKDVKDGKVEAPVKGAKGNKAAEQDPANFKYKLETKAQQAFINTLSKAEQTTLKHYPDVKANIDLMVNTELPAPKKASTTYFIFADSIRPQIRDENPGLSITGVASKIGDKWKALTDAQKEKYAKIQKEKEEEATEEAKIFADLLAIQDKAVAYYMQKLKIPESKLDQIHPVKVAAQKKEDAKPKTGLPWDTALPLTIIKKITKEHADFPAEKAPTGEVVNLIHAVVESFVYWLGQQLAIKAIGLGKKTAQPVFLKLISRDEPQSAFMRFFPCINDIQLAKKKGDAEDDDEEEEEKPKKKAAPKKAAKKTMNDDEEEEEAEEKPKKAAAKKPTAAAAKKAAEAEANKAKMANMLSKNAKKNAMTDDDEEEDEDDKAALEAAAKAKKAKKAPAAKAEKVDKNDPLAIPAKHGLSDAALAQLNKEKAAVKHIVIMSGANDVQYVDTATGDEITDKAMIKKYNNVKNQIDMLKQKDESKPKKRKSKTQDSEEEDEAPKKQTKKQKTKAD